MDDNPPNPTVRLALPSKGRMEGETLEFLAACGLRTNKTNPRQYTATIPSMPEVLVLFQRARDIPDSVKAGDVDLGISGMDVIAEKSSIDDENVLVIHDALGYGHCSLVLAVPQEWTNVGSVDDLREFAAQNSDLRIACKYPNLVERFFVEHAVEGCRIVAADGALEAAPSIGSADFIADITSTGTTLRDNHLKQLQGGTLIKSQASLIGNRAALQSRPELLATTRRLLELIEAQLRAHDQYMIWANVRGESAKAVAENIFSQTDLGGLTGPTIAPVFAREGSENGWYAVNIVTSADRLYPTIEQLRAIGGSGVVVTPVTYIFEERPVRWLAMLEAIGIEEEALA
jgi:ATP phosphoribosyltransferase